MPLIRSGSSHSLCWECQWRVQCKLARARLTSQRAPRPVSSVRPNLQADLARPAQPGQPNACMPRHALVMLLHASNLGLHFFFVFPTAEAG